MKDLEARLPGVDRARRSYLVALDELHRLYTSSVSTAGHAISLEAAALVCAIARVSGASAVADLGSGFSSAALRLMQARGHLRAVSSVDDSAAWLARSSAFCRARGLSTGGFHTFARGGPYPISEGQYDLVVYDLGRMPLRKQYVSWPRKLARRGGFVFYDDTHKEDYYPLVRAEILGLTAYDVREATLDSFGRWGVLAEVV